MMIGWYHKSQTILRDIVMARVLIVDGGNMGHRCKHSYSDMTFKGESTSVIYGFTKVLMSLSRIHKPDAIVVCWDGGTPTERLRLAPGYKAGRDHGDDTEYLSFLSQVDIMHGKLPSMFGVASVRRSKIEADDLIAACCDMLDSEIVIVSSDRDLYQLINENVSVYDPNKREIITEKNFTKFSKGIGLTDWLMYKAMIGDPSDNISGVPGVGPVSARKVVEEVGSAWSDIVKRAGLGDLPVKKNVLASIQGIGSVMVDSILPSISLASDISGARLAVLSQLERGMRFDLIGTRKFLQNYGIISLAGVDICSAFASLSNPHKDISVDKLESLRFPWITPRRVPVE